MTIPSHRLLTAAVNTLRLIENRDGYKACCQASDLIDDLFARQLGELNAAVDRLAWGELHHCLRMLVRRDARLAGVSLPSLDDLTHGRI